MVTAVVLIDVAHGHVSDVAEAIVDLPGVTEVYSVGGRYDLVAIIRVRTNDEMAALVTGNMMRINDIVNTETLIAFRAYSEHDLDTMFDIGEVAD